MDTRQSKFFQTPEVEAINARLRAQHNASPAAHELSEVALIAAAREETGLVRFGDDCFVPGLRALLKSLATEAQLNPLGRFRARFACIRSLKNRLWANACYEMYPEILGRKIAAPIIIVGPIRSGGARVQSMLAADTRLQHMKVWEGFNPAPRLGEQDFGAATRRDEVATFLERLHQLSPGTKEAEPMAVDDPYQEKLLLQHSFLSLSTSTMFRIPGYTAWLLDRDKAANYRDMANFLRLISWSRGDPEDRRWVLRTPQHMLHLDALLGVFPDAQLLFAQRDPLKTVASTLSLGWNFSLSNTDTIDRGTVRDAMMDLCEEMARRCMLARETIPPARQHDMYFEAVNRDWRGVMRGVYDFIGMNFTPTMERSMAEWLARSEREGRHRNHRYAIEDFGMTAEEVDRRMMFVRDRYGLGREDERRHPLAESSKPGDGVC